MLQAWYTALTEILLRLVSAPSSAFINSEQRSKPYIQSREDFTTISTRLHIMNPSIEHKNVEQLRVIGL